MSLATTRSRISHHTKSIDGLNIFYREAGNPRNPVLVLLGGYPSSSAMFRDLISDLADKYHLIAPDYPGFGNTETPPPAEFTYTFDHLTEIIDHLLEELTLTRYSLYVQDYGAPVGFRLAVKHPERIEAIIVQNANAYEEGFTQAWAPIRALWENRSPETEAAVAALFSPETTRFFYTQGTLHPEGINPDNWNLDQFFLDRRVNRAAHMDLFYDYRTNPVLYPQWHAYFREHQPRTLVAWGKNDPFFGPEGAEAFRRDLPNAEIHLLDTGHFALEEDGDEIARLIRAFLR